VSHKFPSSLIVTYDDDTLYSPENLLELIATHQRLPNAILGHRGTELAFDGDLLLPYADWPEIMGEASSSRQVFLTCSAGNLYPPQARRGLLMDLPKAMLHSPRNDDLWYFFTCLFEGIEMRPSFSTNRNPSDWGGSQDLALWRENVAEGNNATFIRNLVEYFDYDGVRLQQAIEAATSVEKKDAEEDVAKEKH